MSRTWVYGRGWVVDRSPRPCVTCGVSVSPRVGKGRPFVYCTACAPPLRDYMTKWLAANAEHVREYQRNRSGYRAKSAIICAECGAAEKNYVGDALCSPCRHRLLRKQPDPTCPTCGTTFTRRGGRDTFCSKHCRPSPSGGHSSPAYKRAVVGGERIVSQIVFERDGWMCQLCSRLVSRDLAYPQLESASLDHILPISRGGPHTYANVQLAHLRCNRRKGAGRSIAA